MKLFKNNQNNDSKVLYRAVIIFYRGEPIQQMEITLDEYHLLPGRLRIMIPGMRKNKQLADYLARYLSRQSGIDSVEANPLTGRVLIRFDLTCLKLAEIQAMIMRGVGKNGSAQIYENIKPVAMATHTRSKILSYLRFGPVLYTIATGIALLGLIVKRVLVGRSPIASSWYVCNLGAFVTIVAGYPLLRSGVKVLSEKKQLNSDLLLFFASLLLLSLRESLTGLAVLWLVYLSSLFQFIMQVRSRRAIQEVLRRIPESGSMGTIPECHSRLVCWPKKQMTPSSEFYERNVLIGTAAISAALLITTRDIHRSIAVLLAGCPVAVALARNTAQGAAIAASLRQGILVKDARYLEMAAQTDMVLFDKFAPVKDTEAREREFTAHARIQNLGIHSIGLSRTESAENSQSVEQTDNALIIIKKARNDNNKILFVAGRENAAPALAASHLGVVLEGPATSSAMLDAADVVMTENDPRKVANLIQLGRDTEDISHQNILLATGLNLLGIALASSSILTPLSAGLLLNVSTAAVVLNSARILSPLCIDHLHYTETVNCKEETACSYP